MFYRYLRRLVMLILWALNGNAHYHHLENIPDQEENYILVAPHRTWWDPVYMAFATRPKQFIFMAKKELFTNRVFGWWIRMCGAFPIDRENPGASAIKYPVKMLKSSNRSLIMFPSGSRHSTDVKGGVALIAKMAKVRILPVVYVGVEEVARRIQTEFDRLDAEVAALEVKKSPNILLLLPRLIALLLSLIVGLLTFIFSFIASFVWDPDKHRK